MAQIHLLAKVATDRAPKKTPRRKTTRCLFFLKTSSAYCSNFLLAKEPLSEVPEKISNGFVSTSGER